MRDCQRDEAVRSIGVHECEDASCQQTRSCVLAGKTPAVVTVVADDAGFVGADLALDRAAGAAALELLAAEFRGVGAHECIDNAGTAVSPAGVTKCRLKLGGQSKGFVVQVLSALNLLGSAIAAGFDNRRSSAFFRRFGLRRSEAK